MSTTSDAGAMVPAGPRVMAAPWKMRVTPWSVRVARRSAAFRTSAVTARSVPGRAPKRSTAIAGSARLPSATTVCPSASSRSTTLRPTNPPAPVTSIVIYAISRAVMWPW